MRQLKIATATNPLWQSPVFLKKYEVSKKYVLTDEEEQLLLSKLKSGDRYVQIDAVMQLCRSAHHLILQAILVYTDDENLIEPLVQEGFDAVMSLVDTVMKAAENKDLYKRFLAWHIRQAMAHYLKSNGIKFL